MKGQTNCICLSNCSFASNERQNGWTERSQILCGTSHEGLWMIKLFYISLQQRSIFIRFLKYTQFFYKICELVLFYYVLYKEKMFTISIEDGREAPWKRFSSNLPLANTKPLGSKFPTKELNYELNY